MEGTGEVVEWAVKMKRLPDAATLRAHLERGEVGVEALEELARRLARFHAAADSGDKVADGGSLRDDRPERARELRPGGRSGGRHAQPIDARSAEAADRGRAGPVSAASSRIGPCRGVPRDTHGDLRLDHVYWFPDRDPPGDWVVVDCIEFDERFRYADPVADIAFLAMELTLEGRGDLAGSFVDAYLGASAGRGRPLAAAVLHGLSRRGAGQGRRHEARGDRDPRSRAGRGPDPGPRPVALRPRRARGAMPKTVPGARRRSARDGEVVPRSRPWSSRPDSL